jgi:uncharacterized membrane protein
MIKIHRLGIALGRLLDQAIDARFIEVVMIHQRATNGLALFVLHRAIDRGKVHQERRHR